MPNDKWHLLFDPAVIGKERDPLHYNLNPLSKDKMVHFAVKATEVRQRLMKRAEECES